MKMSIEEKKVEAQTEKKPAGDDAVVLLSKKVEEYGKKLDGVITKMESIESELGKVKVASPETHEKKKEEAKKPIEEEVKKEENPCPEWAKKLDLKLDELLKVKKTEEDEDEAKKKVKKEEAKKKVPEEDEETEEEEEEGPDEEELDAKKKEKVKGAKVEDGESVKGATSSSSWYDEIKAASKKFFPDM